MIMKWQFVSPLLLSVGLSCAGVARAADPATPVPVQSGGGVYETTKPDGSIELTNLPTSEGQEPLIAAPAASATPDSSGAPAAGGAVPARRVAPAANVAAPGQADPALVDQPKDVREQYRDRMLSGPGAAGAPATASNPAVSRRYKMMDKEAYRAATAAGNTSEQPAPAAQPDPATR
jgi:hypothetical protein